MSGNASGNSSKSMLTRCKKVSQAFTHSEMGDIMKYWEIGVALY